MSSHLKIQRRTPRQPRGERRVAELLEAAENVIAAVGYEAATMSAIADRARASIGSLYQFFPNKVSMAQALRTEYAKRFDQMYAPLAREAKNLNLETLAGHLIRMNVRFVEAHPALPALLDAPLSTRAPAAMRKVLRERFAGLLRAQNPRIPKSKALLLGTATLHVIKALNQLYAELSRQERTRMVQEFKMILISYFNARLKPGVDATGPRKSARRQST